MFTCVTTTQFKKQIMLSFWKTPLCPFQSIPPPKCNPYSNSYYHRLILPVFELHINGIVKYMKYLLFGVWHLLLSTISWFIHVMCSSCLFIPGVELLNYRVYIYLALYTICTIYSFVSNIRNFRCSTSSSTLGIVSLLIYAILMEVTNSVLTPPWFSGSPSAQSSGLTAPQWTLQTPANAFSSSFLE